MKHTNKKGFTIVELVIVIAVIAILAAVLIPTFTNLVKKANQSADLQAARQMSTVLAAEPGIGNDIDKVIDLLVEAGYNAAEALKPITKDHAFYYFADGELIALVDVAKGEVVFPKDVAYVAPDNYLVFDLGASAKYIDVVANSVDDVVAALALGSEYIKLEADITINRDIDVTGANVTLDLNGKVYTTVQGSNGRSGVIYTRANEPTVVSNGTLQVRSIQNTGNLTIKSDVIINAMDASGGACIRNKESGNVTIEGGTFNVVSYSSIHDTAAKGGAPAVYNENGTITILDGTFTSVTDAYLISNEKTGTITIAGGNFTAHRGVIAATDGTIEINGGTFATNEGASAHVIYANNGHVVVNGGTFTGSICVDGAGTGSITLKAGVVVNGVTLAADVVLTAGQSY